MKRIDGFDKLTINPAIRGPDGGESHRMTIRKASELAREQGIVGIMDMAKVFTEKEVIHRIALAEKRKPVVRYFFNLTLTPDEKQIREAARAVRKYPQTAGLKLYTARDNKFSVSHEKDQRKVYRVLAEEGYTGVLAEHCEKESLLRRWLFNPCYLSTYSLARPLEAETESIEDQIKYAVEEKFQGKLYICHISCFKSAEIIWQAKKYLNIYSEVTPHALLWNCEDFSERVNPPLRDKKTVRGLLKAVKNGMVDCIGTDFAPNPSYLPGIASYELYGQALDFLRKHGVAEERIDELTYWNIKRIFGDKLKEV